MNENKKIIIGLVGESGSGKDTVADYLKEKYGAILMRFADPLRETLSLYVENISREDLQWFSFALRNRFGNKVLSETLRKKIEPIKEGIVFINGMRVLEDYDFVKSFPNSYVVYVTLDQKSRWERIYTRKEKSDDKVSFEKFQEMERAEIEVNIPKIGEKADFRLENTGTKEELFAKVDEVVSMLQGG
ncbi:MAG: AAA family ATPase [Candidatus Moranbacteria bacterium]|nr:AAA family ATPase [Candidatus Moranbacteria bacterium]